MAGIHSHKAGPLIITARNQIIPSMKSRRFSSGSCEPAPLMRISVSISSRYCVDPSLQAKLNVVDGELMPVDKVSLDNRATQEAVCHESSGMNLRP